MEQQNYNVIGVMSGTSLDGVDVAHISLLHNRGKWQYKIHKAETIPYTPEWSARLRKAVELQGPALSALNEDYTTLLAGFINSFMSRNKISIIDAICSHGHTVLHQPHDKITLQIGNLPKISALTGKTVVCDFRVQDVALGGQGAPLVPIGDRLLFSNYDYCLNLGGFSNISFEENSTRLAYDICPVNIVLNRYAESLGYAYDAGGLLAAAGAVNERLLGELNSLPYYNAPYPKSLGLEFVLANVYPLTDKYSIAPADILATFTLHIAQQISRNIVSRSQSGTSLFITGGGAYNTYLLQQLKQLLPYTKIIVPDNDTIEYKEALIFGLLGVLRLRNEHNALASVTGAARNHSSGKIFTP
ncbi:anhydro-N-acetylmuramic acid kinase [Flavobacterium cyanobacteriorum]|uniref:Anhydro-N-acetylmuramic acid kinase n=1 Tax=Flavobacterium cyanobacteriorum TaxID=2022802 RepID=A0A255Z6L0_9FLAO|nr:anhydro-N-acetylmuramic acid kinase [Flavobacterium cyanobacteriorum]OYQ37108.1 anhydro-N-acetylmuramic acid kinase [Flavobacterium cyanobacteriorum]